MAKFQRRNSEYGIATICFDEKTIKLDGREIYETEDKDEISLLINDPEMIVIKEQKAKK